MENNNSPEIVFCISKEDLQIGALEKLGRTLNDEEIHVARKGLASGLLTGIDAVYNTIFFEMLAK